MRVPDLCAFGAHLKCRVGQNDGPGLANASKARLSRGDHDAPHWITLHNTFGGALAHFVPLAALDAYRVWKVRVGWTARWEQR